MRQGLIRQAVNFMLLWMLVGTVGIDASASSLQVSPIQLRYTPTEQAQALYLQNTGTEPLEAQVRVMRWSQADNRDVLEKAEDMIASPAIVRVEPGRRQVIRLARRKPLDASREKSYRVLVDELPRKPPAERSGLEVLMRYSIPAFVEPAGLLDDAASSPGMNHADLSRIRASVVKDAGGKAALQVKNEGPAHLRISHASLVDSTGGSKWLAQGLVGYVLPGQQMRWPLASPYPLPSGHILKARFNDDRESRPIPLVEPGS